jgi:hypothetical protein
MAVERHVNVNDIESVVCRLKGIIAVSVVSDSAGDVSEVHILAGSSRSPKQVVRDVESAVMARLGIAIDHKKISVAQVDEGTTARYDHTRLRFSDVSIAFNGNRTEATVRLLKDTILFSGTANGTSSPISQVKLIATATLRAIEESGMSDSPLVLEDANEVAMGGRRVAVVLVSLAGDRGEEFLSGSAVIKQDVWKGVVNATLDAVNRRLSLTRDN